MCHFRHKHLRSLVVTAFGHSYVFHAGPQHNPRRCDPGCDVGTGSAGRGHHQPVDPVSCERAGEGQPWPGQSDRPLPVDRGVYLWLVTRLRAFCLGLSGTGLRHRWYRRILVYQSRRWILSALKKSVDVGPLAERRVPERDCQTLRSTPLSDSKAFCRGLAAYVLRRKSVRSWL
jgi:hypothetical protein